MTVFRGGPRKSAFLVTPGAGAVTHPAAVARGFGRQHGGLLQAVVPHKGRQDAGL